MRQGYGGQELEGTDEVQERKVVDGEHVKVHSVKEQLMGSAVPVQV